MKETRTDIFLQKFLSVKKSPYIVFKMKSRYHSKKRGRIRKTIQVGK